jgi:small GTP-binding protein
MIFKIVLIGNTSVGKTNILSKYLTDQFDPDSKATVGVEFGTKNFKIENNIVKVQIWDTAGQERYRSITTAYYRGAAAICVCFDITNRESFNNLEMWFDEVGKYTDNDVDKVVLANKCDLEDERKVKNEEVANFEKEHGIKIMNVSAKTGEGIENAFKFIVEKLIKKK